MKVRLVTLDKETFKQKLIGTSKIEMNLGELKPLYLTAGKNVYQFLEWIEDVDVNNYLIGVYQLVESTELKDIEEC